MDTGTVRAALELMARIVTRLFSVMASGQFGKLLSFSCIKATMIASITQLTHANLSVS